MSRKLAPWLLVIALLTSSCSLGLLGNNKGVNGKASAQTARVNAALDSIADKQAALNDERLTSIGAWSKGTDYALSKETNQTPPLLTARQINERVEELANQPNPKELRDIYKIIDGLLTNNAVGQRWLEKKDKEVQSLRDNVQQMETDKDAQVDKALKQSEKNAAQADQYKSTLSDMDSFWGFGAIKYGAMKFLKRAAWGIGIFIVIYLVVLIGGSFNPVLGGIRMAFDGVFSVVMRAIKLIAPGAHRIAGLTETHISDGYKQTLTHIVDSIQLFKEKATPPQLEMLNELLVEVAKSMDSDDKDRVDAIKKSLNWK